MHEWFRLIANRVSVALGSPSAFMIAALVIAGWALSGPLFGFSDTWQLVINTSTTIVTFLMVFVIQNTQNRESKATQLKLDELIRAIAGARNQLLGLENGPEAEIEQLGQEFKELRRMAMGKGAAQRGLTRTLPTYKQVLMRINKVEHVHALGRLDRVVAPSSPGGRDAPG